MTKEQYCCERCGDFLHPDRIVWLVFDQRTSTYTNKPVPPEFSQGRFPFGKACSKRILAEHKVVSTQKILKTIR